MPKRLENVTKTKSLLKLSINTLAFSFVQFPSNEIPFKINKPRMKMVHRVGNFPIVKTESIGII